MFQFIEQWRQNRHMKAMIDAGAIFPYWDGTKVRHADPFRIWRELTQDPAVNLERLLPEVDAADGQAIDTALAHVCKVFQVTRWNEETQTGLTDLELLNLLSSVLRWTNFVKKNSSPGPTSSPDSPEPISSTFQEHPDATRNASSDYSSTEIEKTPDEPMPCCEQSATASAK